MSVKDFLYKKACQRSIFFLSFLGFKGDEDAPTFTKFYFAKFHVRHGTC